MNQVSSALSVAAYFPMHVWNSSSVSFKNNDIEEHKKMKNDAIEKNTRMKYERWVFKEWPCTVACTLDLILWSWKEDSCF